MGTDIVRVGVREFRDDLARYLDQGEPVAVTRYGQTVGIFLPIRPSIAEQDVVSLRQAADRLRSMLAERGISEDEVVNEFRARHERR